jgi:hypothetical protein
LEWLEWTAKPAWKKIKIPVDRAGGVLYFATAGRAVNRQKQPVAPWIFDRKK